eukprot:scaffold8481_cov33-Attheya_sp.AAC.1
MYDVHWCHLDPFPVWGDPYEPSSMISDLDKTDTFPVGGNPDVRCHLDPSPTWVFETCAIAANKQNKRPSIPMYDVPWCHLDPFPVWGDPYEPSSVICDLDDTGTVHFLRGRIHARCYLDLSPSAWVVPCESLTVISMRHVQYQETSKTRTSPIPMYDVPWCHLVPFPMWGNPYEPSSMICDLDETVPIAQQRRVNVSHCEPRVDDSNRETIVSVRVYDSNIETIVAPLRSCDSNREPISPYRVDDSNCDTNA